MLRARWRIAWRKEGEKNRDMLHSEGSQHGPENGAYPRVRRIKGSQQDPADRTGGLRAKPSVMFSLQGAIERYITHAFYARRASLELAMASACRSGGVRRALQDPLVFLRSGPFGGQSVHTRVCTNAVEGHILLGDPSYHNLYSYLVLMQLSVP